MIVLPHVSVALVYRGGDADALPMVVVVFAAVAVVVLPEGPPGSSAQAGLDVEFSLLQIVVAVVVAVAVVREGPLVVELPFGGRRR